MATLRHQLLTLVCMPYFIGIGCSTTNSKTSEEQVLQSQKTAIVEYLDTAQPKNAHAELRPLLAKHPKDADLQNLMGLAQLALGNKDRATNHFRTAYKLNNSPAAALNLSSALIEQNKLKEAERILLDTQKRGLQNYPYPERLSHNLGLIAEKRKDLKSAERHYTNALEENPGFYLSLLRIAEIYEKSGRQAAALSKYEAAHNACPACYDPVKALARSYIQRNRTREAAAILAEFMQTDKVLPRDRELAKSTLDRLSKSATKDNLDQKRR